MRPLRVAIIHPFLFRYARGMERFTFNLANALARRGGEVEILTWRWAQPIQIDTLDGRVRTHAFPTSRYHAAKAIVPFYAWHLLTHAYDFVWIYFAGYGEAEALTLARRQKCGIVFHYPYAQVPHRYGEFRRFRLAERAARIVSVSGYVAEGVRESLGRDSVVIHHGVDTARFTPDTAARMEVRQSLNLAADTPLLLTAAALEERKGVQWVLRAMPHVLKRHPDATYLVLGDGPHRSALEQLARDLRIDSQVRFLGAQEDVAPFFQAAEVSLILARGEASSLTALESLACGLPVIAAQQPPFDELITADYGIMVDETDERQVEKAVTGLLSDSARRQTMGVAGRARILADFTWERVAAQYAATMKV